MGFACEIKIQNLDAEEAVLESWLKRQGDWVTWNEGLFVVSKNGHRYEFRSAMPGVIHEQLVKVGDSVSAETTVALVEAEGDEIPYGRPWGTLVAIDDATR